jgi:hypothetical protein
MKARDDNGRQIHADPGMAAEQVNFDLNSDPPDPDTKGGVPDPGDGFAGSPLNFASIAPHTYPEEGDSIDSHALPMPLA